MEDREPTVRSRELGAGLREAMKGAGLNGREAGYLLGWSESWVSRLLLGKRGGNPLDVAAFLGTCRVKNPERDRSARFAFYLHESVLRLPVGGAAVMFDQLDHLLRMSMRSYLTLRVIPVSLGAHAATAGPFIFMEFAEFKPIVYLESPTSSLFLEEPDEIQAYRCILAALAETALGEGESRELIATLATELYADREDQDDRA